MRKDIIVLTKSIKHNGYCVAGIDAHTGEWVRLVSDDHESEGAVPAEMLQYSDGSFVQIYDVISVEIISHVPTLVQPENYLYAGDVKWRKIGVSNLDEVIDLHGYDNPRYVFGNTDVSLPSDWRFTGESSLLLLNVPESNIWIKTFQNGSKTVSLNFTYNNEKYMYMRISQKGFRSLDDGSYSTGSDSIVFSLTDRYYYNGKYYKVVAQILD